MRHVLTRAARVGVIAASTTLALSSAASPAAATIDVPQSQTSAAITVELVAVNGSGCPAGTTAVAAAPDGTGFTVTYSHYLAHVGVGAGPTDFRKNCQLGVLVRVAQGFTYAIAQADYRGYASLAPGAVGLQRTNYYFAGSSANSPASHTFGGPYDGSWQTTDRTDIAALVFAPCGIQRIVNINTELRVRPGTSNPATTTSLMVMDSADAGVSTFYHFAWKRCP